MKVYNFSAHRIGFSKHFSSVPVAASQEKGFHENNKKSKAFYSLDFKFPTITSIILFCSRLLSSLNPDSREGLGSTLDMKSCM